VHALLVFHVGFISAKIIKIMIVNYIVLFVYLPCIQLKLKLKNMIAKEITFNQEAKDGILEGVNIVADAVGSTLGYRGKTVLIEGSGGLPSITKDGVSVAKAIFLEKPLASCGAELLKQAAQKTVDQAGDGPQPLNSKILTINGWTTMGDIKEGDLICGTNNTVQTVLGVFPKGKKEVLKVKFSDGREVECCEEHLWNVSNIRGKIRTIPTKQIIADGISSINQDGSIRYRYFVPEFEFDFNNYEELPLDPYLLGLLIGDGSLSGSGSIELSIGLNKEHILDKIKLPKGIILNHKFIKEKNYIRIKITGCDKDGRYIKDILNDLKLFGVYSNNKFIPNKYLYSSKENRKKLLQGLLDTDGHINKRGLFEYSTISNELHLNFIELARSLGRNLYIKKMDRKENSSYSSTSIYRIFELKGYQRGIKLISIESTNEFVDMQCIKVSNEDSLYITNDYVFTHNTTTTTVLARDIIVRADESIKRGASPIDVKNGIDEATKQIIEIIKKSSKPVVDDFFFDIANISANNDEELGGLISDAFLKAGKNGVVTYEASEKIESYVKTTSGMPIERGYTDDRFSNKMLDNPLVFVCNRELKSFNEIDFIIKHIATENKELLIISDLSNDLKQILLVNNIQGKIKVSHLTPPEHEYTDKRKRYMEDIAIATGATYIDSLSATHLESLGLTILGQVGKCNIGKEETVIELLNNTSEAIENRIDELNKSIDDQTSTLAVDIVKDRIAKLSSSISIVKVGGATEIELSEKLDRVEDAIHAVNSAIKEGVVSGGGLALYDASFKLDIPNNSKSVGYHVLQESVKAPFKKILDNANVDYKEVEEMLMEANSGIGYDVKKYDYANMIDSGIIDPARVVRCALENAVSVAGQVIQLGCTINFKRAL